jgi:hypothetical protein
MDKMPRRPTRSSRYHNRRWTISQCTAGIWVPLLPIAFIGILLDSLALCQATGIGRRTVHSIVPFVPVP